jgi:glycosyltransferase involved in cell wall biosynthesis
VTLWYDLSTSLNSSGMSGTVRTELEVCRALQKRSKNVRLFRFGEAKVRELTALEYPWLFDFSKPICEQYLKSLQEKKVETEETRDDHFERLTSFAHMHGVNSLDRGRKSLLFALSVLPPALLEPIIETLGPHSQATFELMQRLVRALEPARRPSPSPTPPPAAPALKHPFAAGDAVFTVGIDWAGEFLPFLDEVRKTTAIFIHQVVHDLTPIVVPHFHVKRNCELYREFFHNVSKTVDCVWYISEQTKLDGSETQKKWRIPTVPSRQIRWGCELPGQSSRTAEERKTLLAHRGVTRPFFLFVSTVEVRKNHETVYRAYRQLVKEHGPSIPQLVFAGHGGWKRSEFLGWLHRDPVVKGHLCHFAPNEAELEALYRDCLFTVYPSHYEGWGLPIVESLAYGKPVIISDAESLREAAGDAAERVLAVSVQAWVEVLSRYLFDKDVLAKATQRQNAGFTPVSWTDTADQILAGVTS